MFSHRLCIHTSTMYHMHLVISIYPRSRLTQGSRRFACSQSNSPYATLSGLPDPAKKRKEKKSKKVALTSSSNWNIWYPGKHYLGVVLFEKRVEMAIRGPKFLFSLPSMSRKADLEGAFNRLFLQLPGYVQNIMIVEVLNEWCSVVELRRREGSVSLRLRLRECAHQLINSPNPTNLLWYPARW